jgi:hypothetical protein
MKHASEMASYGVIYVTSLMKIVTGIQTTLRFCLSNSTVCDVGITDGRNL